VSDSKCRLGFLELVEDRVRDVPLELTLYLADVGNLRVDLFLALFVALVRDENVETLEFADNVIERIHIFGFFLNAVHFLHELVPHVLR